MNTAAARISPLFPSDPTEWEKPLTSLGWELKFGHVPDKQPGPGQVATGEDLGIVMGDFRHQQPPDRAHHPTHPPPNLEARVYPFSHL